MNNSELFEEQTQITEENSNATVTNYIVEEFDSKDEVYKLNEDDIEDNIKEDSTPELAPVTKQCIYVSLKHLKPFSGVLYDEKGNKSIISGNPFFIPDNYLESNDKESESIKRLHASIEQEGVLTPLLVRHAQTGQANKIDETADYEILSGYRRKRVCEELAKTNPEKFQIVPVLVIEPCNDDTANSIITSSNVQRREISLLETIKSCGRMYRALRHRGRKDKPSLTADTVSQILGLKPRTVRRYSQLLELPEEMLELVATKAQNQNEELRLPIKAGEILAGIHKEKLEVINKFLRCNADSSISVNDAKKIKKFCVEKTAITEEEITGLLDEKTSEIKEGTAKKRNSKRRFSLDNERLKQYCEGMTDQEVEDLIYQLIAEWGERKTPNS